MARQSRLGKSSWVSARHGRHGKFRFVGLRPVRSGWGRSRQARHVIADYVTVGLAG